MGRQRFYGLVLYGLMLSILISGDCPALTRDQDSSKEGLSDSEFLELENKIETIVSQIEEKHSIRVYYKAPPFLSVLMLQFKVAPRNDYGRLADYLYVLQEELGKYPEDFLKKCDIKSFVVGRNLAFAGRNVGGFANYYTRDVYCTYIAGNSRYSRKTIHHEIYHMLDASINGSIYYKDPDWTGFNGKDFSYDKTSFKGKLYHPRPGFVSEYSKTGPEEDKAEVYSALLVEETSSCVHDWIVDDEILRNKVNHMKESLLQFSDHFTHDFWAELSSGNCQPLEHKPMIVEWEEKQDLRFLAVLPHEEVTGLIAITEGSGEGAKWWKPDGEVFDEPPFAFNAATFARGISPDFVITEKINDGLRQYYLFYYTKNNAAPFARSVMDIPEGRVYRSGPMPRDKDGRLFVNVSNMSVGFDQTRETGQMRIGIALGEWDTLATYNPKTKTTSCGDQSVRFDKPYMKEGRLTIDVFEKDSDFKKTATELVAVDKSGETHYITFSRGSIKKNGRECSFSFEGLKISQVKEFRYNVIPYTWASFENISLRPGKITEIQVKIEDN